MLLKAVMHAQTVEKLCLECADEQTCLEANAYASWMAANLDLVLAVYPAPQPCLSSDANPNPTTELSTQARTRQP